VRGCSPIEASIYLATLAYSFVILVKERYDTCEQLTVRYVHHMNGGTAGSVHVRGNRTHTHSSTPTASAAAAKEDSLQLPPSFQTVKSDSLYAVAHIEADADRPEKKYRRRRRRRPHEWVLIGLVLTISVTAIWRLFFQLQQEHQHAELALLSSSVAETDRSHMYTGMHTPTNTDAHNRQDDMGSTQRLRTKAEKGESSKAVDMPSTVPGNSNNDNKKENKHYECGLYIAQSTIPNAGMGIFTATAKKPLDPLGSGDVCIPAIDINYHNPQPVFNPFQDYYWKGSSMGMSRESHSNDLEAFCPGLDCAINCNLALINTHKSYPMYDSAGLHRSRDPGAGALTPYHNGTTYAARHIPAGGELFKFYGNEWFTSRPHLFDGNFPLLGDFTKAEYVLRNMTALNLTRDIQKDLYENVVVEIKKAFTSRILGALPLTVEDAVIGAEQELAVLHQPAAVRPIEWLRQHGRCIDNIAPASSSIRQAGHGAVATRPLEQNQIITTSPLHHLPMRTFVEMYNYEWIKNAKNGKTMRRAISESGQQILVNYCFGHHESSLLLCPYGNGVNYLNHNQTRANVGIRWPASAQSGFSMHNTTQVEQGFVDDLMSNLKPQLALDYVALRDIKAGEELFLDYGDRFEEAWQRHAAQYRPVTPNADDYVDGFLMNFQKTNDPVRTEQEQESHPYPDHIQIRAHPMLHQQKPVTTTPESEKGTYTWVVTEYGLPAKILERSVNETAQQPQHSYTIQIGIVGQAAAWNIRNRDREANVTWVDRENVPRSALSFFDKPSSTDMHLPNAFRHAIGIPDDIFPKQWKNREQLKAMMFEKSLAVGKKT
jgi:hypothetical protein